MITFNDIVTTIPVYPDKEEGMHIHPDREYFAVTPDCFVIYAKPNKCWYCLLTKRVIPGSISDLIDKHGDLWLHVPDKPMTHGKWGHAPDMDSILDLFNSRNYINWLNENT